MYLTKSVRIFFGTNAERTASGLAAFLPGDEYYETDTTTTYVHDGMQWREKGGGGAVAGSDTQVIFNDGGAYAGDSGLTFTKATDTLTSGRVIVGSGETVDSEAKLGVILLTSPSGTVQSIPLHNPATGDFNETAFDFHFEDDASAQKLYARIEGVQLVRTAGSEDGEIQLRVIKSGTLTPVLRVRGDNGTTDFLTQDVNIRGTGNDSLFFTDFSANTVNIGTNGDADAIATFGPSVTVFNNSESDRDFRIAGSGVTNGVYYDAGNSRLGLNTGSPERSLHIVGDLIRIDRDGNSPGFITRRTTTGLGANSDISAVNSEALSSASTVRTFGSFGVRITDNTDGAESALYRYRALVNGSLTDVMSIGTNVGVGTLSPTEKLHVAGNVAPTNTNTWDIGTSTFLWDDIWATNGTIQTSDVTKKQDIRPSDLGLDFINTLDALKYKFKGGKRDHYGISGQQLESVLAGRDFAGLIISDGGYGVRYTELIAPIIKSIQELSEIVDSLRGEA